MSLRAMNGMNDKASTNEQRKQQAVKERMLRAMKESTNERSYEASTNEQMKLQAVKE